MLAAAPASTCSRPTAPGASSGTPSAASRAPAATRSMRVLDDADPVVRRFETPLVGREDELDGDRSRRSDARFGTAVPASSRCSARPASARPASRARSWPGARRLGDLPRRAHTRRPAPRRRSHRSATPSARVAGADSAAGSRACSRASVTVRRSRRRSPRPRWERPGQASRSRRRPGQLAAWWRRCPASQPVILVLEDLHWASPPLLDLVEHIAELARGPILLLALARPDLLETRPEWAGGRLNASTILLEPLPARRSRSAARHARRGCCRRRRASGARSWRRPPGNPLFLEQLLAAALEGRRRPRFPTRFMRCSRRGSTGCDEREREVAQAAAVCGQRFARRPAAGARASGRATRRCASLARRDLVAARGARRLRRGNLGRFATCSSVTRPMRGSRSAGAPRCTRRSRPSWTSGRQRQAWTRTSWSATTWRRRTARPRTSTPGHRTSQASHTRRRSAWRLPAFAQERRARRPRGGAAARPCPGAPAARRARANRLRTRARQRARIAGRPRGSPARPRRRRRGLDPDGHAGAHAPSRRPPLHRALGRWRHAIDRRDHRRDGRGDTRCSRRQGTTRRSRTRISSPTRPAERYADLGGSTTESYCRAAVDTPAQPASRSRRGLGRELALRPRAPRAVADGRGQADRPDVARPPPTRVRVRLRARRARQSCGRWRASSTRDGGWSPRATGSSSSSASARRRRRPDQPRGRRDHRR